MEKGATLSRCRKYRYVLWRKWDNFLVDELYVMFICLNPSTADEKIDDKTVIRCINFAKDWGFSGMYITNLFAYRTKDVAKLLKAKDPVGPRNDHYILETSKDSKIVVAAWGSNGKFNNRDLVVMKMLPELHYLKCTKDGHPWRPLYLPKDLKPKLWEGK